MNLNQLRHTWFRKCILIFISIFISYLIYKNGQKWIVHYCSNLNDMAPSCSEKNNFIRTHVLPVLGFFLLPLLVYSDKIIQLSCKIMNFTENLSDKKKWFLIFSVSFFFMASVFYSRFSFVPLNPNNNLWLQDKGDWNQCYLGWYVFKHAAWNYPYGMLKNILYPHAMSFGYTDSIPLLAVFFKLFRNFLSDTFQYQGIWLFSCYIFQALFASLIVKNWHTKLLYKIISALLISCSTILLFRSAHITLNAHWLILASFYVYFTEDFHCKNKIILQSLLLILSASFHPYLTFMVSALNCALLANLYIQKKYQLKSLLFVFVLQQICILLIWYFIGYFSLGGGYGAELNYFTTNLNAFFNSMNGNSSLLSPFPIWGGQQEGFSYLGVGLIIGLLFLLFEAREKRNVLFHKFNYALIVFVTLLYLISLGTDIRFGHFTILNYHMPGFLQSILGPFSACGRFAWPAWYLLSIFIMYNLCLKERNKHQKTVLFILIAILQFMDIKPFMARLNIQDGSGFNTEDLKPWLRFMGNKQTKILFYPPYQNFYNNKGEFTTFWYLAAKYNYVINMGYTSRINHDWLKDTDAMLKRIKNGDIEEGAVYVAQLKNKDLFKQALAKKKVICTTINGFYVCKFSRVRIGQEKQ